MKNKSVDSYRFVHPAKIHCIGTRLNKLFKIEFERGELEKSPRLYNILANRKSKMIDILIFSFRGGVLENS